MNKLKSRLAFVIYDVSMIEKFEEDNGLRTYEIRQLALARQRKEAIREFIKERARRGKISNGRLCQRSSCHAETTAISDMFDLVLRHKYMSPAPRVFGLQSIKPYPI